MSYSKRELYALGEPLGDSATKLKVNGDRIYGGGGGGGKGDSPDYVPMKPARVTTGFGTGLADPERGLYNYTLDPRLAAMRDIFYGATPQFMPTAQEQQFAQGVSQGGMGVYGQGQGFLQEALGTDTAQVGQDYYNQIQNLMAMDRAQEEARLADTLFKTGRTGVGAGVQGGYVNPEQFALLKAREQANQQLAINAAQYGRAQREGDVGFASRLMGTGLSTYGAGKQTQAAPYQAMAGIFGLGTGIEGLGLEGNLNTAMRALPFQQVQQANAQAYENAKAASGGKGGLGGLVQTGLDIYGATQGMPGLGSIGSSLGSIWGSASSLGGSLEGIGNVLQYGSGGVSPFAGVGGIESNPYLNWRG